MKRRLKNQVPPILIMTVAILSFALYQWLKPPEVIIPEEKILKEKQEKFSSSQQAYDSGETRNILEPNVVHISSSSAKQGDTVLVKIPNQFTTVKPEGKLESIKINFLKLAENWIAIIGIDAKKEPGEYKVIVNFPDGQIFQKEINILQRKFPVTELLVTEELREKGYTPSKIAENIITKENLALKEVLSIFTEKPYFDQVFIYPLKEIEVVGAFGNIRKSGDLALQHLGVDLDAAIGTPVYAVNDGLVRFSENLNTYGKTLIIDHGLGIFSLYLHLDEFKVVEGKRVERGKIIGLSGNTGYSISPHLHLSIKVNDASVDPLRFIETIEKEIK